MARHLHLHVHDAAEERPIGLYETMSNAQLAAEIKKATGRRYALRTLQIMNEEKERRKKLGKWDQPD